MQVLGEALPPSTGVGGNGAGSAAELQKNTAFPLQVHSILQIYSDKEVTLALLVTV